MPPIPPNLDWSPDSEPEYRTIARTGWGENFRTAQAADWPAEQFCAYRAAYYQYIEMVDHEIGRILSALTDSGLDECTLVVFISDHGDGMGAHHLVTKPHMTEETIRVPCIVRWSGHLPAGVKDTRHCVSGVDLFPTLCDFADIPAPGGLRGDSWKRIIDNPSAKWRDYVISQETGGRTMRIGNYKYIRYAYGARNEALYNLQTDPGEMGNLVNDTVAAEVLHQCRERLDAWMTETGDSFSLTNVPQRGELPPV